MNLRLIAKIQCFFSPCDENADSRLFIPQITECLDKDAETYLRPSAVLLGALAGSVAEGASAGAVLRGLRASVHSVTFCRPARGKKDLLGYSDSSRFSLCFHDCFRTAFHIGRCLCLAKDWT